MAALARREDSVVAALGELKGLEDARRRAEVEAAQRALDAQLAAQRDAAAAQQRAIDDTERRLADEARAASVRAEAERRAERLVAIEAEARAKAAAEIALAAERQAQELAIKREAAQQTRPVYLIAVAAIAGAVAILFAVIALQRGNALDDARAATAVERSRAGRLAADLAGVKTRVARLEDDLARSRAAVLHPVAPAPGPAAPAKPPSGKRGGGGARGATPPKPPKPPPVDVRCADMPLGCPGK